MDPEAASKALESTKRKMERNYFAALPWIFGEINENQKPGRISSHTAWSIFLIRKRILFFFF
jgi:hypothetical protein